MIITVEEFEKNLDYYLEKSQVEEILIIKNEIPIASLLSPKAYEELTGNKI